MKKTWKNGFNDGSGKGTITYGEKGILRVHWGCSCCDGFDAYYPSKEDKKLIRFADKIVKILNERKVVS
jgi:hypothetical protein